ncbi:LuxR family transcriptional regulator [Vibrio amylolyticus]|uniref:LuxR family transcriptional regulator n=1 Tax=Vibrio amylolyticus TaxID=2847292 RepID=UPI00355333A5
MKQFLELIESFKQVQDTQSLNVLLKKFAVLIESEHFALGMSYPTSLMQSEVTLLHNYPQGWMQYYMDQNYQEVDAVVKHSISNHSPILWEHINKGNGFKKEQLSIMDQASGAGLKKGFSVPIHGLRGEFGILSFSQTDLSPKTNTLYESIIPYTQLLIPALTDAIQRIRKAHPETLVSLTKREKECLSWVTEGKSSWEISQILGCAERTVIFHLNNAMAKLNATNRYQAISKAIIHGILVPH